LFDTPTGEVIDLSEIGVYTNEDVDSATDFESDSTFGTQAPRFIDEDPNGVISGTVGEYVFEVVTSSVGSLWVSTGGTNWDFVDGPISIPANLLGGIQENEYYYDERTDRLYLWENPTGFNGQFTLATSIYAADFQTTRPVEGVRIDDKLYIATGTYPVYYKGDGKIYVFEQYEMSDLDLEELGYDLNAINIADFFDVPNAPVNGYKGTDVAGAQLIEIRDVHKNYKVGHTNSTPNLILSVDFGLADVASLNEWSTGTYDFDSSLTNPYGTWSGGDPTSGGWKRKAELLVKVYTKLSSELSYPEEELEGTDYNYTELNNKYSNDKKASVNGYLAQAINNIPVFTATLPSLTPNLYDFKVELYLLETGWLYTDDGGVTVGSRIIKKQSFEIVSFRVFPEELTDYLEEPIVTIERGVHACNRVIEHNGRLGFFGNPTLPDWVFFSTAGARNYFPSRYSLQFTNELQEEVTAINKFMNILVVQSPSYTWGIKGDVPFPVSLAEGEIYRKITINPTIGCIAPKSVKNVRNQLYFLSKEGIFILRALYAEDSRYNVDPIDRNIYNIVPRDEDAIAAYYDDQYWLHFPQSATTLRYYVDKKAWVKDTYSAWNSFGGIHKYINESGVLRFITDLSQLETGNPLKVFDIDVDYSLPTDLTKNITSRMTTSYLNQDYPFHPKNYKEAKFDFAIQNEYNTATEELTVSGTPVITTNYIEFQVPLIDRHFYSITFEPTEITGTPNYTVQIDGGTPAVLAGTITVDGDNLEPIRFLSNKTGLVTVTITMATSAITEELTAEDIKLYDSTYDHTVTFNTMVLSEEGTLNIDPIDSYTSADVALPIELGTRLGNWTFGTSNFGNVIVAVKTVKLSGRGYNSKISIIEDSKSKWTLESLGITYKMKKARSR
jgi:hypothetical protein